MIDGVLWDKANKSGRAVAIIGKASIYGLNIGGGPILPPDQVPPDGGPPGGGVPPHPEHPIWGPPGINFPPGPGFPPVAGHPLPPIPPDVPPIPPDVPPGTVVKPPPDAGGWAYISGYGWGYFPMGSGPGPKGQHQSQPGTQSQNPA
jgi:hypothetical protein